MAGRGSVVERDNERPSDRKSSSDHLVRDLIRGLYDGRYAAGQRLAEPDLMRRYGVGRSTVREAIQRLAAEGIVATHPFRGAQIRQLSRTEARNVLLILELLVGLAARQAAASIEQAGCRRRFVESFDRLLGFETEGDSYELVRARNHFYRTMTHVGGNAELERLLSGIQVHLVRAHSRLPRERRFADYRAMAEAVLAGELGRAEKAARSHIRRVAAALAELPDAVFASDREDTPLAAVNEDQENA
ncbi:MAG: GntR family transcriptional regulator [Parvibaculaceae bacterium]